MRAHSFRLFCCVPSNPIECKMYIRFLFLLSAFSLASFLSLCKRLCVVRLFLWFLFLFLLLASCRPLLLHLLLLRPFLGLSLLLVSIFVLVFLVLLVWEVMFPLPASWNGSSGGQWTQRLTRVFFWITPWILPCTPRSSLSFILS